MSETSKRDLKQEIIYGIPEFKTADELVKFMAEGDIPRRKADLKEWYLAGEGLQGLTPDQQEVMLTRSPHYQKYLHDLSEVDKAVPKIAEAIRASFDQFQKQFLDRNRKQLEEKLKVVADSEKQGTELLDQYKNKLKEVKALETEVTEKGKRYDAELMRVNAYDLELKKRDDKLNKQRSDLELKIREVNEKVKSLRQREADVAGNEKDMKEISDALTYARLLKANVGSKVEKFYDMLDAMTVYFQDILKKQPGTQVPAPAASKEDDLIEMPKSDDESGETMLGMGNIPRK